MEKEIFGIRNKVWLNVGMLFFIFACITYGLTEKQRIQSAAAKKAVTENSNHVAQASPADQVGTHKSDPARQSRETMLAGLGFDPSKGHRIGIEVRGSQPQTNVVSVSENK